MLSDCCVHFQKQCCKTVGRQHSHVSTFRNSVVRLSDNNTILRPLSFRNSVEDSRTITQSCVHFQNQCWRQSDNNTVLCHFQKQCWRQSAITQFCVHFQNQCWRQSDSNTVLRRLSFRNSVEDSRTITQYCVHLVSETVLKTVGQQHSIVST